MILAAEQNLRVIICTSKKRICVLDLCLDGVYWDNRNVQLLHAVSNHQIQSAERAFVDLRIGSVRIAFRKETEVCMLLRIPLIFVAIAEIHSEVPYGLHRQSRPESLNIVVVEIVYLVE